MSSNPLKRVGTLGQSIWLDYIRRDLIASGELRRLIEKDGLRGMTSNPSIFENVAAGASATASLACVETWHEDFLKDLTRVDVPTLVIHGDADRILPISASGLRTARLIKEARLVVKDGPHCITWTHADEVNRELVNFL